MPEQVSVPPPIEWAQRNDILFVSVAAECKDVDYKFTDDSMHFSGTSVDGTRQYDVTLNFRHKIDATKVATKNTARRIEFCITKAEVGPYWDALTTDKKKPHFVRADFNKWRDEDDEDDDDEGANGGAGDFGNMQNMFANLNAAGGKPNFDDFGGADGDEEDDSDDEEIPNLE